MEVWDGEIPLPELVLAVWCLSEVRSLNKIEDKIGDDLLFKVVDYFLLVGNDSKFSEILRAIVSIGPEWLGKIVFQLAEDYRPIEYSWLLFLSVVFYQRAWIEYPVTAKNESAVMHGALDILTILSLDDSAMQETLTRQYEEVQQVIHKLLDFFIGKYRENDGLVRRRASVAGTAASLYGMEHSLFGKVVFISYPSVDLTFTTGYLDPRKPITAEHIQKAAEEADIPPDKIDEAVRSLSEHMGWDITKGSEAGKLP